MEKFLLAVLLAAIAFSLYLGYAAAPSLTVEKIKPGPAVEEQQVVVTATSKPQAGASEFISLKLVGVDESKQGQLADLRVELVPGSGRVFIAFSEDNPVLQDETQESLKIAVELGRKFATRDASAFDLHYSVTAPSSVVGGKSAGAAVAVATIALLTATKLRSDAVVTGGVNADGTVTPVGEILSKADAAKKAGFAKIIVPSGEGTAYVQRRECAREETPFGFEEKCVSKPVAVQVSEQAGIEVVEVRDVVQALSEMSA